MSSFKAGSIYYTVEVDGATLKRVKDQIKQVGDAARAAAGGSAKSSNELKEMGNEARILASKLSALKSDLDDNRISSTNYGRALEEIYVEATGLRRGLESLGGEFTETSADMARYQTILASVAGTQERAGRSANDTLGGLRRLGSIYTDLDSRIKSLGSQVRELNAAQEQSPGDVAKYTASMEKLQGELSSTKAQLQGLEGELKETAGATGVAAKDTQRLSSAYAQLQRHQTAATKGMRRATGSIRSVGIASQLSYGATTLLNDRIFQMSPALGILTNQLNFTTKGMKAWLSAILPIIAVAGTLIGILGGLFVSLKSGVGLESALADVRKTTNLTNDELVELTESFQGLSMEIPATVTEMLDIARVAGQLGITGVQNVRDFTRVISELGIATDVVGEQGATQLARFLNALGTDMDDMGTSAERVANVLNQLENTTAATASEILQMTSYTQGLSSQAGATDSEILALNATLLSLGVKAEAGGSAVVRTIADIQVAGSTGGKALQNYAKYANMTVDEFQALARNAPVEALVKLTEGLQSAAGQGLNLNDALIELGVVEVRERRALLALAQGADVLVDSLETANAEAETQSSLSAEVAIQAATAEAKIKLLGNRFRALGQDVGRFLNPAFKAFLDLLLLVVDNMAASIGILAGLAAAFLAVSRAITVASVAGNAFRLIGFALSGPAGIILAITAAVAGGIAVWQRYASAIDKAVEATGQIRDAIGSANDKEALSGVVFDLAENLEGDAKDAWISFAHQAIATGEDIEEVKNNILRYYVEIANAEEIARVTEELRIARRLFDRDAAALAERTGRPGGTPTSTYKNELEDLREAGQEIADLEAQLADLDGTSIDFTVNAKIEPTITGNTDTDLGGGGGGENLSQASRYLNPLRDAYAALSQSKRELEVLFYQLGELTAVEYQKGLQSELERTRNALVELVAVPEEELALSIQEAAGRDEAGNYLISLAEAADTAAQWQEEALRRLNEEVLPALVDAREAIANLSQEPIELPVPEPETVAKSVRQFNEFIGVGAEIVDREDEVTEAYERNHHAIFGYAKAQEMLDEQAIERARERVEARRRQREQEEAAEQAAIEAHQAQLRLDGERQGAVASTRLMAQAYGEALRGVENLQDAEEALYRYFKTVTPEMIQYIEEMFGGDELVDSLTSAESAVRDLGKATRDAFESSNETIEGMLTKLNELSILYSEDLLDHEDYISEQLRVQRDLLEAMVLSGGDFADEIQRAREEIERLEAIMSGGESTWNFGTDGNYPGNLGSGTAEAPSTSSAGTGFAAIEAAMGPVTTMLDAFVVGLGRAAEASALVGGVMAGFTATMDEETGKVTLAFSPMEALVAIIGRVLDKSEAFQLALDTLDTALDPIIDIVDQLFTALQPIIEVAVQLVKVALLPFMFVMENIVVPVLTFIANIIATVWNAIARAINSLPAWLRGGRTFEEIDPAGTEREDPIDAPRGSIAYFEELLSRARAEFSEATTQSERDDLAEDIEDLEETIARMSGEAPGEGSLAALEEQLSEARENYRQATDADDRQEFLDQITELEKAIAAMKGEPYTGEDETGTAGTTVMEFSGPTRELLMDVAQALSILPSWTSMIRDIRNDVRAMATSSGAITLPTLSSTLPVATTNTVAGGQVYNFDNVTITTGASNVRDLTREISRFTYKERRGGK